MSNLNELIQPDTDITIRVASAINNAGQITGWATASGGTTVVAVLLTPINQPQGDLDHDCTVGLADFFALIAAWGSCSDCGTCPADFDGDCNVGIVDFLLLLGNWTPVS